MHERRRQTIGGLAAAVVVVVERPQLGEVAHVLSPAVLATGGIDTTAAVLAGATLWLMAARVLLAVVFLQTGRLPGAVGRAGRRAAVIATPRLLRPVVLGAVGAGLTLGSMTTAATALARSSAGAQPPPAASATAPASAPAPGGAAGLRDPGRRTGTGAAHTPAWPTGGSPAGPSAHRGGSTTGQRTRVVVRSGDSLWRIAARALPADAPDARIAAAWPRWFAANARVIGDDPNLIRPGQVLRPPPSGGHP